MKKLKNGWVEGSAKDFLAQIPSEAKFTLGRNSSSEKRRPVFGILGVSLLLLVLFVEFAADPRLGGRIDIHIRNILPFLGMALAVLAFIRRERAIWPIIGIVLTAFYVGLHLIAIP